MRIVNVNKILIGFVFSIILCQGELIHISKIHYDGTPREVIIYQRVNDDLKSNNPFTFIETLKYDSKGNYIRPPLTGEARNIENWIIGKWVRENSKEGTYIQFYKDHYKVYEEGSLNEDDSGEYYIIQNNTETNIVYMEKNKDWRTSQIKSNNRNQFILDSRIIINRIY